MTVLFLSLSLDNDECFVYLSSCIGKSELPSALIKIVKNGIVSYKDVAIFQKPSNLIKMLKLDRPIYSNLCRVGISGILFADNTAKQKPSYIA